MKATLDELAAGIRSDLDQAKRIEASARRTWHCGWRALLEAASQIRSDESLASLRNGRGSL